VKEIAAKHCARDVRVCGSVARGEDGPGSDIDLLGVHVDVVSAAGLGTRHEAVRREARAL
jgi:predicted nucleotidyltransferase